MVGGVKKGGLYPGMEDGAWYLNIYHVFSQIPPHPVAVQIDRCVSTPTALPNGR